jgi:hypothetical protein
MLIQTQLAIEGFLSRGYSVLLTIKAQVIPENWKCVLLEIFRNRQLNMSAP